MVKRGRGREREITYHGVPATLATSLFGKPPHGDVAAVEGLVREEPVDENVVPRAGHIAIHVGWLHLRRQSHLRKSKKSKHINQVG